MEKPLPARPAFGRTSLKIIAALAMLCDHFAYIFLNVYNSRALLHGQAGETAYLILRSIGRISFPIFCFVLVQGFLSTRDVKKYMLRLFLFAILSEIPFDLAFFGTPFKWAAQNVLFTMLIGILVLYGYQQCRGNKFSECAVVLAGCLCATLLQTDYSYIGILFIFLFYAAKRKVGFLLIALLLFVQGRYSFFGIFALPFCYFYQPGKKEWPLPRYFFYCFYPIHLLVLRGIWQFFL